MAWLKVSFSPVSGAATALAGCALAALAFLATVRFAGAAFLTVFAVLAFPIVLVTTFLLFAFFMGPHLPGLQSYGGNTRSCQGAARSPTSVPHHRDVWKPARSHPRPRLHLSARRDFKCANSLAGCPVGVIYCIPFWNCCDRRRGVSDDRTKSAAARQCFLVSRACGVPVVLALYLPIAIGLA